MNNVVKKLSALLIILIILFMSKISSVYASTTFTTCTLSEGSYIRNEPGGTPLKDVDGNNFLIYSPKRLEVIDSKYVSGREYKKIRTNYYSNNYEGWIYSGYLKDFKTYTTDDNYGNSLRSAGFPESYILPLQKLHAMYPNWNFIPSKLGGGLDFNTVIAQEYSPVYKNLINSKDQSLYSTDGAAYNSGKFTEFEPGWYAPSKQTIAFYMDPRNWLMDNTIFMFEQLSYNSSLHTEAAVQKVLDGTFMQGSYDYNGTKISYAKTFVEAGKLRNVSPVQLASRVVQEQGVNGNSLTINMKSDGKTYYNFFNINAYGSSNEAIVSNALNTAKENGWDNPYSSIIGGSSTISNGYNNVGQDTIYYQKFNTINSKNIDLEYTTATGKANGYFAPIENKICVNSEMSLSQTTKTLLHEYVHSQLHKDGVEAKDNLVGKQTAEIEAEATTYVVSKHFGFDTSEYSFDYVSTWARGKDVAELGQTLKEASEKIINEIKAPLELELYNNRENIEEILKSQNVKPNDKIINNMIDINKETGKINTISDLSNAEKYKSYDNQELNNKISDTNKEIATNTVKVEVKTVTVGIER